MKFAVLGFFGLLAVAAAYPYPEAEHPRYPVPSYAERYQWPEAPHDDNREFKGLVRALVQSMDQPETNHETPYNQMSAPDVPDVPVHSREYNDLVSALAREERPEAERRPLSRAQEKLDRMNVKLQSRQQDILNKVEDEMAKHPDVRPGTPEYAALLEKIHGMFPHNVAKCPDGSQETNCLQSPCEMASCPAHPSATCKEDYCGGCNYYFIEGDTKYAGRDCYVVEDAGQKAYTAAKEVLAQHGKMAYDELLRKMHEKLDMPLIQTNHKYLDPSHASFNPVPKTQSGPYQSRYGDMGRRPAMPRYGNAETKPQSLPYKSRPVIPRYGNAEMAPRYGNVEMERDRYPNHYNRPY